MTRRLLKLFFLLVLALPGFPAHAQGRESALSDAEVEKLRETAFEPPERMFAFIDFLDVRSKALDKLYNGSRHAGREEDTHTFFEQFTSISEDLDDNLDDWGKRHLDVRKVLPKLLAATERWQTALKSPPDNQEYNVSRKLALDAVADVRESATKLLADQKAYFLAHPPGKPDAKQGKPE